LPYLIMPHVESCFQGAGVWSVFFISCVVLCLGVVEGKSVWRGRLSETIKAVRMRGGGKECRECGKVVKTQ
jgi:hypothetical protein